MTKKTEQWFKGTPTKEGMYEVQVEYEGGKIFFDPYYHDPNVKPFSPYDKIIAYRLEDREIDSKVYIARYPGGGLLLSQGSCGVNRARILMGSDGKIEGNPEFGLWIDPGNFKFIKVGQIYSAKFPSFKEEDFEYVGELSEKEDGRES